MAEEITPGTENQNPDNQGTQEVTPVQPDYQKKFEESEAARTKAEADAAVARADVSKYQSEADKAKALLGDTEKLGMQREEIANDAHSLYINQIERDYPDVFNAYGDTFANLKGAAKDEYIRQAQYLQAGLDKVRAPKEEKKEGEIKLNNNEPPKIPIAGQNANYQGHVFTRQELQDHRGDIAWFNKNETEINAQMAQGLIQ